MLNGGRPPLRRRKWRQLEERIVRLREQFQNGQRDNHNYWNAISHVIVEFNAM